MVDVSDIRDILFKLLDDYHSKHDLTMVPIKVDHLKPLLEQRGFIDRFIWEQFDFDSENIIAQVLCYKAGMGAYAGVGDYARIQYSSGLNFCWQRIAICKEMIQCVLDAPNENRVESTDKLLLLGELFVSEEYAAVEKFPPFETEHLALIVAIETLFPLEHRAVNCIHILRRRSSWRIRLE
jgi:hypothetical protein